MLHCDASQSTQTFVAAWLGFDFVSSLFWFVSALFRLCFGWFRVVSTLLRPCFDFVSTLFRLCFDVVSWFRHCFEPAGQGFFWRNPILTVIINVGLEARSSLINTCNQRKSNS